MSRASFVLLIMIVVLCSTTIAQLPFYRRECPVNQEWNDCGTFCPPSCDKPVQRGCIAMCNIGCECKKGFLLNSFGNCVHPLYC